MSATAYKEFLEKTNEIGYADQVVGNLVYASGLPGIRMGEVVVFDNGEIGMALSIGEFVEILALSVHNISPGMSIVRTGQPFKIPVGDFLLGMLVRPLSISPLVSSVRGVKVESKRIVDVDPVGLEVRDAVTDPFDTGVTAVDLITPLGKGQRQLVLGDRKTGKSKFIVQVILNQAKMGTICIYGGVGKKKADITELKETFAGVNALDRMVLVYSYASDPPGLSFLTPYVAMTIAEYFRDQGKDVLVVLDDLSTHAKFWREISLLARRFPGRNAYPGDIYYIHSKLLERAGNFKKGSITCLPVAETVLGDISGYIQTNLMSMTDGHIFFDSEMFNQGRRPSVNPLLSVTRVGLQTHSDLIRDIARTLTSFLVYVEKMKRYTHFGAELSEEARLNLELGERVVAFLEQKEDFVIPINANVAMTAGLWAGVWRGVAIPKMKEDIKSLVGMYEKDSEYKKKVDALISRHHSFKNLIEEVKREAGLFVFNK